MRPGARAGATWAKTTWFGAAAILAIALAVLIPGQASLPVTDRDEARFAQASRQMLETGVLIDIRFQDQPRWKKPVGIYWLQALAVRATGSGAIWAYRLPSAVAMVLAALATAWAARPILGPRAGLAAGAILATAVLAVVEGHIAKTDAALCLTAVLAFGALARLVLPPGADPGPGGAEGPAPAGDGTGAAYSGAGSGADFSGAGSGAAVGGAGAAAVFWAAMTAAVLLKGPVVPAIVVLALATLWVVGPRPRLGGLRARIGLPVMVLVLAPWLVAIGVLSEGRFFADSLGTDLGAKLAGGQEAHGGPPGLYLILVWATFWPWAALLPMALPWAWGRRHDPGLRLLAAWVVPFWLVLELVPTKLPHYVLPLYPMLAILVGGWLASGAPGDPGPWRRRAVAAAVLVPGLVLGLAIIGLPLALEGAVLPLVTGLALAGMAATVWAARAALAGRPRPLAAASLIAALALIPAALGGALPRLATVFPSPALAALAAPWMPCATGPLISVGYREPSLVFLTATDTWLATPDQAAAALRADPGRLALVEDRLRPAFDAALGPVRLVERGAHAYFNPNRGSWETARLVMPIEGPWRACAPSQ